MNEENILIVRCGEVALKGKNKPYFERMLVDRIKRNLKEFEGDTISLPLVNKLLGLPMYNTITPAIGWSTSETTEDCENIITCKASHVTIEHYSTTEWTLDGEYGGAHDKVEIEIIKKAHGEGHRTEARVVSVVERSQDIIVGTYEASKNFGFVVFVRQCPITLANSIFAPPNSV